GPPPPPPATGWRAQFRVWFWRLAPLLPAWAILIWVGAPQQRRWPVWLALAVALAGPALVVAQRRALFGPLALLIVPLVFFWRARGLQSTLPAGHWTTLWTNARCTDRVVPAGDGSAWCVNIQSERVYHFRLQSGRVMGKYDVPDSWDILEAAPVGAWVRQDPIDNLVFASGNTAKALGLYRPVYAAAREPGELWYVDWNQRLRLHTADEPAGATLTHQDGLLRSRVLSVEVTPDGSVWVGAQAGLNHLPAGSSTWERFGSEVGLRGSILRIIPAPDGAIWLLQPRGFGANGDHWGASARTPAGAWLHLDLEALTGFEMPRGHDSLAVDGLGRLWLFLVSNTREKYLAVLDPDDLLNFSLTSMGKLSASGSYRANAHGVVSDGAGGILLYNGELEPLRHWTP
ncbi:MAG: hypothetical protein ACE5FI_04830, partial [Anaerolineales bacterium]